MVEGVEKSILTGKPHLILNPNAKLGDIDSGEFNVVVFDVLEVDLLRVDLMPVELFQSTQRAST